LKSKERETKFDQLVRVNLEIELGNEKKNGKNEIFSMVGRNDVLME
jgi:hypothetical protein